MPINPITLNKMEPIVIKEVENKIVDRIVHEIKGAEIKKESENKNSFNGQKQERAAEEFKKILSKYYLKLEYKVVKDKIKIKLKDKKGNTVIETEVDDVEKLLDGVRAKGSLLDIKG